MRIPLRPGVASLQGVTDWVARIASGVVASFTVEHRDDGLHRFPWIDVTYNASMFRGSGGMTWSVLPDDVKLLTYRIVGDACTYKWRIATADCSGGSNQLLLSLPAGLVAAKRAPSVHYYSDAGTEGIGLAVIDTTLNRVQLFKTNSAANWTATATDNTYTEGSIEFPISR